jgi:hypothetical protein
LLEGIPSQTVKKQLFGRMAELESRKKEIEPQLEPVTAAVKTLLEQLAAIRRTLETAEKTSLARLLDSFVEKVIPHFEIQQVGPQRKRRAILRAVEFIPRQTERAKTILPEAMKVGTTRKGRGSWRRPGRSGWGRWWR